MGGGGCYSVGGQRPRILYRGLRCCLKTRRRKRVRFGSRGLQYGGTPTKDFILRAEVLPEDKEEKEGKVWML